MPVLLDIDVTLLPGRSVDRVRYYEGETLLAEAVGGTEAMYEGGFSEGEHIIRVELTDDRGSVVERAFQVTVSFGAVGDPGGEFIGDPDGGFLGDPESFEYAVIP